MRRILLVAVAATGLLVPPETSIHRASGQTGAEGPPVGSFRATVEEVIKAGDVLVYRVAIEVRPNSMVRLTADKADKGGISCRAGDSKRPSEVISLTVLADQVGFAGRNVVRFRLGLASAGSSAVSSRTGPVETGKKLGDLFSIVLESGTYREGERVAAIQFEDLRYSLVVAPPEP